jgi:putative membrane protein insertion efficiency factor
VTQIRSAVRLLGAPARFVLISLVRGYRATLSGWLGGQCRFYPSCSHYAEEAIRTHGALRGTALAIWRVGRCNPFGAGGVDHVPGSAGRELYDAITRETAHRASEPRERGARARSG